VDSERTEFRPDAGSVRRAQRGQLWWIAWAGAFSALAASVGVAGGSGWTVLLGAAAVAVGLGMIVAVVLRHRRLGRVLREARPLVVHAGGLELPGEPPLPWPGVAAVVAHRLKWGGLEVTRTDGRQLRIPAQQYGCTVDDLAAAVARYVPVGDPDAAYRAWGDYLHG
jgi:hypothetical protein